MMKKVYFIIFLSLLFGICSNAEAAVLGEVVSFNIDSDYDISARSTVQATLVKATPSLYFYFEKTWWDAVAPSKQSEILTNLDSLDQEFQSKIYPTLTADFGSEWKPGIDGDNKIAILFHSIKEEAAGYFRSADEYPKIQIPNSNEREMLYLSASQSENPQIKVFLAHEFVHLITFNQKERVSSITEETWLNEARAEYASTLLGYDDVYEGSNLQKRVQAFLDNPSDSLTEWLNKKDDYGVINLFTQYLVDHYGIGILSDSLKSKLVGIPSINEALSKNGSNHDFAQIFIDWTITGVVNNCSFGSEYCYLNNNLKNFRLNPTINFLPLAGSSSLSVTNVTKNWAGNWQKFIGGNGNLKLTFIGNTNPFKVPYILQKKDGNYLIDYLRLDSTQKGEINIDNFGTDDIALIIIPSIQIKNIGFDGSELTYPFTFTASASKQQITPNGNSLIPTGFIFNKNLYYGMINQDVVYLKIVLANEGCLTGVANTNYFATKTLAAVKCFQNKYKAEISAAAGYTISATGFVGAGTRAKLNSILSGT
jgi:hypothetical protein